MEILYHVILQLAIIPQKDISVISPLLPPDPPISVTNRVLGDVPDAFWDPILSTIRARLDLPPSPYSRMPRGKNPVFYLGDVGIIKLIPPCWAEDAMREVAALQTAPLGGPVATPTLLKLDNLDGWTVLLLERLPGTLLSEHWPNLGRPQRVDLAAQLGAIAAWLHRIEVPAGSPLAYDWAEHLASERQTSSQDLFEDNAPASLQATWQTFLEEVGPLPTPGAPTVFLHGDLSVANVMVQEKEGRLLITGLLDFGDASLGQATHDWLSPGVHNFGGDPAVLAAFCDGYGLSPYHRTPALQSHLLARSVLYYRWQYLHRKFPLQEATTWTEVADIIWPLT
jgi:hygromycin-B 7''-O-kinase